MKTLITILITFLLIGCASDPIEITTIETPRPALILPQVDKFKARNIEWVIITIDNYEEIFTELQKQGKQPILFGLTDDGYESLSMNMQDIIKMIQQYKAIIAAYESYYQSDNAN